MQHKKLINFSVKADAFIMPFKLSQLIKSVDPVKLYEYLVFNKPVISIFYPELRYFQKFIYFYKNDKDIISIIKKVIKKNNLKNNNFLNKFLKKNCWDERAKKLNEELRKI